MDTVHIPPADGPSVLRLQADWIEQEAGALHEAILCGPVADTERLTMHCRDLAGMVHRLAQLIAEIAETIPDRAARKAMHR